MLKSKKCSTFFSSNIKWRYKWHYALIGATLLLSAGCHSGNNNNAQIELSGTVEAREVDLAFQVGGRISELHVDEGDWVRQEQPVAALDGKSLDLVFQQAIATSNAAKASFDALKAGTRIQELRVAEADLQKAQSQLNFTQADVKRVSTLVPKKLASAEQLEQVQLQYEIALASVAQAKQKLNLLREGTRHEDLERAEAQYAASSEASELAKLQLSYTNLLSPVTGMVTVRLSEAGEVVAPGQTIVRITETSKPWVRAYLSESNLGRVHVGQAAKVTIDGAAEKSFNGKLTFISPVAEFTPKTVETKELRVDLVYRIKVEVENPDGVLKSGMPADVILEAIHP
jgi:HlyD family secretion protein